MVAIEYPVSSPAFSRVRFNFAGYLLILAGAAAAAAAVAVPLQADGDQGLRLAVQLTGRLAALLFFAVLVAGPLARFFPGEIVQSLLRNRRQLGLTFAVAYFAHLVALLIPWLFRNQNLEQTTAAYCGMSGIVLASMVLTSNDRAVQTLGFRAWSTLHRCALYFFWANFTLVYLAHFYGPSRPDGYAVYGLGLMIGALLLRFGDALIHRPTSRLAGSAGPS
jgi:DMSO/TMAO reductase YedYZ heme-binding membrane subunit